MSRAVKRRRRSGAYGADARRWHGRCFIATTKEETMQMKSSIYATLSLSLLAMGGCADDGPAVAPTLEELTSMCAAHDAAGTFGPAVCCLDQDTGLPTLCTTHPPPLKLCEEQQELKGEVLVPVAYGREVGPSPRIAIFGDACEDEDDPFLPPEPPPPTPPPGTPPPNDPPLCENGGGYVIVGNETDNLVFTLGPPSGAGERLITFYRYAESLAPGTVVMTTDGLLPHPVLADGELYAKEETDLMMYTALGSSNVGNPHQQSDWFPARCISLQC
jgi:hypothetical protein